ncbi:UNVERIFIED_CONTAM: hypothetical protein RMT77_011140 [Armadillidium vulgare]
MTIKMNIFFAGFFFCILLSLTLGQDCNGISKEKCDNKGGCYCPDRVGCILTPKDYSETYEETKAICHNAGASLFQHDNSIIERVKASINECGIKITEEFIICTQPFENYTCPCFHITHQSTYTIIDECIKPQIIEITDLCVISCEH